MSLRVAAEHDARMREHLAAAYPEEGCGVLLGAESDGTRAVAEVVTIDNRREGERERRYLITPEQFLGAEKQARDRGLDVIGFFHSHPDHPAEPSAFDLEHAWPYYSYLIVSVRGGTPREAAAWRLADDRSRFDPEPLIIDRAAEAR
jgi:proteasome lid subunit RPN8/RPN11